MTIWTKKTEMNVLPDDPSEGWVLHQNGGTATITSGILTLDAIFNGIYYTLNWSANNSTGVTVEARIKEVFIDSYFTIGGSYIIIKNGIYGFYFCLQKDGIWDRNNLTRIYEMNPLEKFFVYRITLKGDVVNVYVDNELVWTGSPSSVVENSIFFGYLSWETFHERKSKWDYLYYSTLGAFEPPPPLPITEDIHPNIHNRIVIIGMDDLISGTIRKSPNSANICELLFHNPSGEKTYKFKHDDNIKLYAGLGYPYKEPLFDGYIYDIYKDSSPSSLPLKINCLDYIGKLQEERILIDEETNYDGWENVSAIRDIVSNCTGNFFTNFAIQGSSDNSGDVQTITKENNIRSDYESRLDVIKKINGFTYDDSSYPNAPKLYYFWQENDYDDTTGEVRRFCFKKITSNAGDMTAVKTLDYGNTIFDSSLREQTQGCMNTAIVKGTDCVFNHSDSTGIYNFLDGVQAQKIEDNTLVNPDDCQSKAVRFVELFKRPQKSIQVRCRDGFMLKPMDIVRVVNPRYGINENFFVIDVDISFSSTEISTVLTLGSQRPYISTYL